MCYFTVAMFTFQTVMFLVSLLVLMINSSILTGNYLQTEVFIALKWHLIQHFQRQWITSISIYLKWLWRPRWRCPWWWHIIRPCRLGFTGLFLFLLFFLNLESFSVSSPGCRSEWGPEELYQLAACVQHSAAILLWQEWSIYSPHTPSRTTETASSQWKADIAGGDFRFSGFVLKVLAQKSSGKTLTRLTKGPVFLFFSFFKGNIPSHQWLGSNTLLVELLTVLELLWISVSTFITQRLLL